MVQFRVVLLLITQQEKTGLTPDRGYYTILKLLLYFQWVYVNYKIYLCITKEPCLYNKKLI